MKERGEIIEVRESVGIELPALQQNYITNFLSFFLSTRYCSSIFNTQYSSTKWCYKKKEPDHPRDGLNYARSIQPSSLVLGRYKHNCYIINRCLTEVKMALEEVFRCLKPSVSHLKVFLFYCLCSHFK